MIGRVKHIFPKFLAFNIMIVGILFCPNLANAQVNLGADTTICGGSSFTLNINGPGVNGIAVALSDDIHSDVVPIPFPFTYFGNVYNSCVIASNNYITFDLSEANQYSPWSIANPIPSPALPTNSIMAPYQDVNPGNGGAVNYATIGQAPNRIFVVTFFEVPMFSCTQLCFGNQIKLFEGTNEIQIHIGNKPLCASWNSGVAIEGIQDATGTNAFVVPGRNYPTQWSAMNDAYSFMPTGPTTYTVNTTPFNFENIITSGNNIAITWTDLAGNLVGNGATLDVTPTQSTSYIGSVSLQCSGTVFTDTITIYVSDTDVDTTITESSCVPGNDGEIEVNATGSFSPYDITIMDNTGGTVLQDVGVNGQSTATGLPPGNYNVTVIDDLGCNIQVPVNVPGPPALLADTNQTNILCNGETNGTATVTVISGTQPYTYLWNDSMNQTTPVATDLAAGLYVVTITDDNACVIEETFVISEPMPLILQMHSITDTCEKEVGTAYVNVLGGTRPYGYFWYGATPALDSLSMDSVATLLGEGDYDLIVTDANGCIDSNDVSVDNIPSPVAKFTFIASNEGILNPEVEFTNLSQNSETWWWDFGDHLGVSSDEHPVYLYPSDSADVYKVTLVSTNEYSCHDTVYGFVTIKPHFTFYIPTAFTPRSNDLNDMFVPVGEGFDYDSFKMTIYDRWGQIIFQTNDIKQGWNGNSHINGEHAPNGTYMYKIEVREPIGFEPKYFYGKVTLIWDSGAK